MKMNNFSKDICIMWNTNSLVQNLDLDHHAYFLEQ